MNQDILDMISTGTIPYQYAYDTESALYFALAVLLIVFAYAIAEALTRRLIG